jgi:hypothetical protein
VSEDVFIDMLEDGPLEDGPLDQRTMTPEAQRIAIAKACGWRVHPKDRFIVSPPNAPHSVQPLNTIPDYLNDLNAMHEAEKVLPEDRQSVYADWLNYVHPTADLAYPDQNVRGFRRELFSEAFHLMHATSAQRAEAFLRTLNLYQP